ncbi:MAG: Bro-N domain-containing protein [Anaerolineae bacterium]
MSNNLLPIEEFEQFEPIRRIQDEETGEYFFAVVDVIDILAEPKNAGEYWRTMKNRDESGVLRTICTKLSMRHKKTGRNLQTECATIEGLLRIIQSIPSKKAEPFKQWLAKVGQDRLEETADPSKAIARAYELYRQQGYSKDWISKRLKHSEVRGTLIAEWQKRDVDESQFEELLGVIAQETFEISIAEHKQLKGLKDENLQDHMTDVEMVIGMLGEVATAQISHAADAQGYEENHSAAKRGGAIGRDALKKIEAETGRPVVSSINYLEAPEEEVRKKLSAGEDPKPKDEPDQAT